MGGFLCVASPKAEAEADAATEGTSVVAGGAHHRKMHRPASSSRRATRIISVDKSKPQADSNSTTEASVHKERNNMQNAVQTFSFGELACATKNFKQDCLLGQGGFGHVYKGHLDNGQVVAVKKLDPNGLQGSREFLVEVLMLSLLHHPNLVNLIGYCVDGNQRVLVYEFMPLGSLEKHLHVDIPPDEQPLDWNTRMKIAAGAAQGLEYLHDKADPPVIYRDFKPSNILLGEGYHPKLSDFGLAKLGPVGDKTHVTTRVMGTHGYCAPEYASSGKLTIKSDVYSFGVVLLELITGRRAIDCTRPVVEKNLVAWASPLFKDRRKFQKMADPLLQGSFPKKGLYQALAVSAMCLQEHAASRPPIREVVTALSYLASQTYDPHAAGVQSNRVSPSTLRNSDGCKNSPDLRQWEPIRIVNVRGDGNRGGSARDSGQQMDSSVSETQESWRQSPYQTRSREAPKNFSQYRAFADPKERGENWR